MAMRLRVSAAASAASCAESKTERGFHVLGSMPTLMGSKLQMRGFKLSCGLISHFEALKSSCVSKSRTDRSGLY